MPITDSRNKTGTLSLDDTQFEKQATAVSLVPSVDEEGDALETLSGDTITPDDVTTWTLNLGVVQDFTDSTGIVEFLRANAGDVVDFEWVPTTGGPVYSGTCKVRPTTIGGDVNVRLTSEVELPIESLDDPDYTP